MKEMWKIRASPGMYRKLYGVCKGNSAIEHEGKRAAVRKYENKGSKRLVVKGKKKSKRERGDR